MNMHILYQLFEDKMAEISGILQLNYYYNRFKLMNRKVQTIHLRPLPPLIPLEPPAKVINILKERAQTRSLTLTAVPEEQIEDDSLHQYKQLYEEKCEIEDTLRSRCRNHEEIIKILQDKNATLEAQITKLQEQKWRKFDYSKLSARGRSKSQKKIPTIDVKVPRRMDQNKQILIDEQKFIKTERDICNEEIEYYRLQIKQCRQQNKQLKLQIDNLKMLLKTKDSLIQQNSIKKVSFSLSNINKSNSPNKKEWNQTQVHSHTPIISSFSPNPKQSFETVKKQLNNHDQYWTELKRLKNELMYKDLLIDKLRTDNKKQNDLLKRHLVLSVEESRKIADQTTSILNSFKGEIIRLSQELQQYKRNGNVYKKQKEKTDQQQFPQNELIDILKNRRAEQSPL